MPGKPKPALYLRWESDPDRTYYYASWLEDRPPWYCSRCGSRYVVCVDGDMARFYICVVCYSGIWYCCYEVDRCPFCSRLAEGLWVPCPSCGVLVAPPSREPLPGGKAVPFRVPGPAELPHPDPSNIYRFRRGRVAAYR